MVVAYFSAWGDVLDDDFDRLCGADDVHACVEETAARPIEPGLLVCAGEVLAGEPEGDDVTVVVEELGVADVVVGGGVRVVVGEGVACRLVVVACRVDGLWAECCLDGEFEAPVAGA